MNVHEFEGKNEEEAISKAIEALGLDREDIDVEIVEAKKSGFLFGGGKVRIRVHLDDERQPDDYRHPDAWQTPGRRNGRSGGGRQRPGGRPRGLGGGQDAGTARGPGSGPARGQGSGSARGPGSGSARGPGSGSARGPGSGSARGPGSHHPSRGGRRNRGAALEGYAFDRGDPYPLEPGESLPEAMVALEPESDFERHMLEFLKGLFEHLGVSAEIRIAFREEKKLGLDVDSPDSAILIGKRGQTLEAIQTVANVVSSRLKNGSPRVVVDSQNYRLRRERSLVRLAREVAEEVRRTRQSRLLEAMNPFERRLIHTTLSAEADIQTASEGEGLYKRVRVLYRGQKRP